MGQRAAKVLSGKLGTSVSIGRLDYSLPSHITLYNVDIKDQQGHDMLSARRLSVRLELTPLTEGKISIATAQLFSVHARFYKEHADSPLNCQFALDSLASKDTTSASTTNLRINSLIMRHSSIVYDQMDAERTPGQLNSRHLRLTGISSHLILKAMTKDSLNVNIKRLAFKEQSGLQVDRLAMRFEGSRKQARLEDFCLLMPQTEFRLGDVKAQYRFDQDQLSLPSLSYTGSIMPSTVTLADLSCLLPPLKTFPNTLSLSAHFNGANETLNIPVLQIHSTTGDVSIDMEGTAESLGHASPSWTTSISNLTLSSKAMAFISENMISLQGEAPAIINRLGSIHLHGTANGKGFAELQTHHHLDTDAGPLDISISLDQQSHFHGNIDTHGLNLRQLLDNKHLGTLATSIHVDGQLPKDGHVTLKADGTIQQLEVNGYNYQNITVNGLYSPSDIHGSVMVDDSYLGLAVEGNITRSHRQNKVHLTADVDHFSPQAVNLSDKWGDARFAAKLSADFTASDINDAMGTLAVTDFSLLSPNENYQLRQLLIQSGYENGQHYLTMYSDFGEAHITGDFNYGTLPQSFTNFISAKLPTLPGLPQTSHHTHNNFSIKTTINKSDWLQHLLQIPLRLTEPLTLQGMIDDQHQQLTLECETPQFYYNDSQYNDGYISILSPLNTLVYELGITKLMEDGHRLRLEAMGSAHNNTLTSSILWDNHAQNRMCGKLTAQASFNTTLDGKQCANIHIAPSSMTINNAKWDIRPAYISYMDKQLDINSFTIQHDQQFLTLNGRASENSEDTIRVQMRDLDIEYVLDMVNFHSVDFSGLATGGGTLHSVFGQLEAEGALTVRQFKFEDGRMGTLHADVNWNGEDEQIDIHATADDGPDAQTYINGYVSPGRNYINLGIRAEGTHLEFAHSFTKSFISDIDGHGQGEVRLAGPLDAINLTGQLVVNGRAHVSTLNCIYEMRNDTLTLVPNEIELTNCPIYDANGRQAILTGAIHHKELTQLTFDIYVATDNLLAYDFRDFGEDTFYGTVFAKGNVAIHGRDSGVLIEADVTPQNGTVFVYNAASPDAINNQDFIEWNGTDNTHQANMPYEHNIPQPSDADNFRSDLTMRLKINATPSATIRLLMDERTNDYITLHGNGELQTTYYNKGGFTMFGTYRVTEGTYGLTIQNIIHKNFIFREGGSIVFGGDPYDATLNLQAQHTVNGVSLSELNVGRSFSNTVRVNCLMNITGQPRQPIVDFDLEMPNVNADEQQMVRSIINSEDEMNQQVIYLLAVGRFYPQGTNNATESEDSPSKTSLAMQSLLSGTLSGQINNVLGQVIKSNNWNFGANISTGDEGWNNAEYEGLISGRLLNNRLLINGQFGYRDNNTTANPSFIGDFDIRYLLYPNGNLALKVYNQTNDRYFTRSSLNTQGLGIIMKKDFDSLSDLFGSKKGIKKAKNVK